MNGVQIVPRYFFAYIYWSHYFIFRKSVHNFILFFGLQKRTFKEPGLTRDKGSPDKS